ncbi:MAG: NADP-dependent malic enzyme [Thermoanaerobaculia bacterium]|nr:NADP-dependent malic enzyme [Thermoanaerobaculia bacterium]
MRKITREEALEYHSRGRKGKIEVVPTKPCRTQEDLSLAYSPGVAEPCLEIARDPENVYEYTARGNLVAVISNGTAVLGLGNIGPLAAKPVMEGKGILFKRFADIDVFDIEVDAEEPAAFVETVARIAPTFGGINLEDIKAPECFEIEEALKKRLRIPVFHDDQHGTAIISAAALLNGLEVVGKKIDQVKVVFVGAGASAIACAKLYMSYGVRPGNLRMVDKAGVIYKGRTGGDMNPYKAAFAVDTPERTLTDALQGADVFVGLSTKGIVTGEMLKGMARDPIVFALANPEPEITPEEARAARPDVIMATGRSDYPNQVNNVLGFPFIFRGALDVRASEINEPMKMAASQALAALAKMDVPDSVSKAYGGETFRFGRDYLIPKPFDFRVLLWVAPAVAEAAMTSGVARRPIQDMSAYLRRLEAMISRSREVMSVVLEKARRDPRRIVFPEGEHPKILRAAKILAEEGICRPILLAREEEIERTSGDLQLPDSIEIIHTNRFPRLAEYARKLEDLRRRSGVTSEEARKMVRVRNIFGPLMLELGDADGVISGVTQEYPDVIRPALEIVGTAPGVRRVSGVYILVMKDRTFFFADTTVNIDPTAEELAEIAILTAAQVRRFDIEPRIAMISISNFGSNDHANARKVKRAVELLKSTRPDLAVDGEMQADFAVMPEMLEIHYPWATVRRPNVLIFPDLQSANAAYKLVWRLAGAEAIGPILLGMKKPVHVLQKGVDVADIVNMAAIAVVDAQERKPAQRALPMG